MVRLGVWREKPFFEIDNGKQSKLRKPIKADLPVYLKGSNPEG